MLCIPGENQWGGECRTGLRQSPIDLTKEIAPIGHYPALNLINFDVQLQNARLWNTGHSSIQIDFI